MGKRESLGGKAIGHIRKKLQKNNAKNSGLAEKWREKATIELSLAGIILGFLLLVAAAIWDILYNHVWIAVFNSSMYLTLLFVSFNKFISLRIKGYIFSLLVYIVGLVVTLALGSTAGGTLWLFAFPVTAGILVSLPAVWYANGINIVTFIVLWAGLHFNWFHGKAMPGFEANTFLITCINLFTVSGLISVTLATLLHELSQFMELQKSTEKRLVHEKAKLQILKDKAETADQMKSSFLANVTHEFRTPMNAIYGFSELLLKNDLPEEKEIQFARIIHEKSIELLHLFNDILDISLIESNTIEIHREQVNIYEVFRNLFDVFDLIRSQNAKGSVVLEFREPALAKDMTIEADPYRIKQVMSNLLTNALKFTQSGKIEYGYFQESTEEMIFFVCDTGIGIPSDKHGIIFERYIQAGDYYPSRQPGFGLGLSICRSLVELMKGKIWVESEPGKGSTFYFSLPVRATGK